MTATQRKLWIHAGRHKTGSSAIQSSLYQHLDDPDYDYLDLGKPNGSSVINNAFRTAMANAAGGDPQARAERAQGLLRRAIESTGKANAILSAESISLLDEEEFKAFIHLLRCYFDDIALLAYFRPPKSDMESAFAENLKTHFVACDAPVRFMHRRRFEAFEKHLGRNKLHYLRYDTGDFPDGNVVAHFCRQVGIGSPPPAGTQANLRLSLPAVRLLYLYRKQYPRSRPEDRTLVAKLGQLEGPPLRFHSELYQRNFDDPLNSFDWLEQRCGCSFTENIHADDALGIRGEADLLHIDGASSAWLQQSLGLDESALDRISMEPTLVAELLREAHWPGN